MPRDQKLALEYLRMEVVPRPKADPRWRMEGRLSCAEKLSTGRHVAHRMSAAWGGGVTC